MWKLLKITGGSSKFNLFKVTQFGLNSDMTCEAKVETDKYNWKVILKSEHLQLSVIGDWFFCSFWLLSLQLGVFLLSFCKYHPSSGWLTNSLKHLNRNKTPVWLALWLVFAAAAWVTVLLTLAILWILLTYQSLYLLLSLWLWTSHKYFVNRAGERKMTERVKCTLTDLTFASSFFSLSRAHFVTFCPLSFFFSCVSLV